MYSWLQVENELPEKIERLVRCEASAYQKLLMRRVEDNLGSIGSTKVSSLYFFFYILFLKKFAILISMIIQLLPTLSHIFPLQVRSVHNSVMELRNICNHPYLSQLHAEEACFSFLF